MSVSPTGTEYALTETDLNGQIESSETTFPSFHIGHDVLRLLIAESTGFSQSAADHLQSHFDVDFEDLDYSGLVTRVSDYDLIWVRLRSFIDKELMSQTSRLKAIITNTTGLTHIDCAAASEHGIAIESLQGEEAFLSDIRATAEHTIALILGLLRQIPQAHRHVIEGEWNRDKFRGQEINEKTVGIIGFGRLGRIVARYLNAFDAKIVTATLGPDDVPVPDFVKRVELDELLSQSDIVSLHANFTEANRNMIGTDEFQRMNSSAIFVNTARGELVDEEALLGALETNEISGAALDVIANEQQSHSSVKRLTEYATRNSNLLLTPHIGGSTFESLAKTEEFLANKVVEKYRHLPQDQQ